MLGSTGEADDAVQEAWIRLNRSNTSDVENLGGWLTTVVARVCLDMLRTRTSRREEPLDGVPERAAEPNGGADPEHEALLADSVGLAMLVVLDTLTPAERVSFVLHDMFGVPFEEIAPIVERSPEATRQLASRARRRVRGAPVPDADLTAQWEVVDAFLAAVRDGDFDALVAVLDPEVVLRGDAGSLSGLSRRVQGAKAVAGQALYWSQSGLITRRALVNGAPGTVSFRDGKPFSVGAFTVKNGKIVEIDFLADLERIAQLDLTLLSD
jgi:RNA polymerase sigma-70 factor (ECF subfamily)